LVAAKSFEFSGQPIMYTTTFWCVFRELTQWFKMISFDIFSKSMNIYRRLGHGTVDSASKPKNIFLVNTGVEMFF
jgi:hypothetical protein